MKKHLSTTRQKLHDSAIHCDLIDLEDAVNLAFSRSLTPLIIDTSDDDKVATFYSYQVDAILLEATKMIIDSSNKPSKNVLEYARVRLIGAMKYGKMLVIRMSTSAPDFKFSLCDDALDGKDTLSYFPKEVFVAGGALLKNSGWPEKLFREIDMLPHKNIAYCRWYHSCSEIPNIVSVELSNHAL